jgi:sulfatase modifying factor 1
MCNIDNRYIAPSLKRAYSSNAKVRDGELRRLDQSVPSGSMETCKSGFAVYDLTGNFDEWVMTEHSRGKSGWAGLKGGAWGHVRNACRPITTSHPPQFTYYFISFRCCKDASEAALPPPPDDVPVWRPPTQPPRRAGTSQGWSP